jgi:hypothetical protein
MEDIICNRCGSINDYRVEERANNRMAYCNGCGMWIKNIPHSIQPARLYFGKHKGRLISEMTSDDDLGYLRWVSENMKLPAKIREAINKQLNNGL